MRRRARHRPEGQGIARTCLEFKEAAPSRCAWQLRHEKDLDLNRLQLYPLSGVGNSPHDRF